MSKFKLTDEDKAYLSRIGEKEEYFPQIEEAARVTEFECDGKKISLSKCIEILGRETFLSGIHRSAFHWTAARYNPDETKTIFFDSSKLFANL